MHRRLKPHPNTPCQAFKDIEVEITRASSRELELVYRATGSVGDVKLPQLARLERADELWRDTCFEVFIKAPGSHSYSEFNFSPSGRWATYGFDDTRLGMRNLDVATPSLTLQVTAELLVLTVTLDLGRTGPLKLAVCAIIEEMKGQLSYWALTHPGERPDFHHPGGFVLDIPEPERP